MDNELLPTIAAAVFMILISILVWVLQSNYEVRTFNACTHSNATLTDAMFSELRVLECKK